MIDRENLEFDYKVEIGITTKQWLQLLQDPETISSKELDLLMLIYDNPAHMATGSQLISQLNLKYVIQVNGPASRIGKKVNKKFDVKDLVTIDNEVQWWHIPFWGTDTKEGFYWKLRPELISAIAELRNEPFQLAEELHPSEANELYEGAKERVYVNRYERNQKARRICIQYYGAICYVCHFDFHATYGAIGKDFIHVHHLTPLSEIGQNYQIDPIKDLRPVCPNCHSIIHKRNPPFSIEEVKEMIEKNKPRG
jgi:5-methylcytosine-specific restriction protein A